MQNLQISGFVYLTSDDSDGQQDINKIQVNKAKCFLKLLSSKDVILYIHLLLEVCEPLKKLSATQQDKTAAVSDIHRILHSTLAVLKKIKSTQVFLCFLFPYVFFFLLYSTYSTNSKQLGFLFLFTAQQSCSCMQQ